MLVLVLGKARRPAKAWLGCFWYARQRWAGCLSLVSQYRAYTRRFTPTRLSSVKCCVLMSVDACFRSISGSWTSIPVLCLVARSATTSTTKEPTSTSLTAILTSFAAFWPSIELVVCTFPDRNASLPSWTSWLSLVSMVNPWRFASFFHFPIVFFTNCYYSKRQLPGL